MARSSHHVLAVLLLAVVSALSVYFCWNQAPIETSLSIYDQYARATVLCLLSMSIYIMNESTYFTMAFTGCAGMRTTPATPQPGTVMMMNRRGRGVSWAQRGFHSLTLSAIPFPSAKVHLFCFSC